MSHTYLIDLYDLIDSRLEDVARASSAKISTGTDTFFQKGRSEALLECKQFLAEQYNSKLPRRLRGKYSKQ